MIPLYLCIYVRICICICIYYVYVYVYVYVYTHTHTHMYTYIYIYIHIYQNIHNVCTYILTRHTGMQMVSPLQSGPAVLLSPAPAAALDSALSRTGSQQQLCSTRATRITLPSPTTPCGPAHSSAQYAAQQGPAASTARTRKIAVLQGFIPESPMAPQAREQRGASNLPQHGAASGASTRRGSGVPFGMPTAGLDGSPYLCPGEGDMDAMGAARHQWLGMESGTVGSGLGGGAAKRVPALKAPALPPPLTPMGYTPRRTQLDESTLQYLMQKWGGRQLREAHE